MLQRARTDMKKPIEKIEVYRANHARVKSGNPQRRGSSRRPASQGAIRVLALTHSRRNVVQC